MMKHFNEAEIPQALLERLESLNFTTPTPIQAQSIPHALAGSDILGSAQTGTGKTGAFGIPLISHMMNDEDAKALILVPTRELALQVMQSLKQFIGKDYIASALLIGGEPIGKQFKQLRQRPRLVVGTPGRVNDHLKRGTLFLDKTNFLVLDEVDRMLDMGFSVQLDAIAEYLPERRQTLMFSATMPRNIDQIAAKYLNKPVRISVDSTRAAAPKIKQEFVKVRDEEKYTHLLSELEARQGSIIIFIKTKYNAENMAKKLRKDGHEAEPIHGDLKQSRRARVIRSFHKKEYRILVATDVAARGLDIPHIEHVINYDAPHNPEDYIHRIGRTARAGAEGEAINFMGNRDGRQWAAVQRLMNPDDAHDAFGGRGKVRGKKPSYSDRSKKRGKSSAFSNKGAKSRKPWKKDGEVHSSDGRNDKKDFKRGFKKKLNRDGGSEERRSSEGKKWSEGKPKKKFEGKPQNKTQDKPSGAKIKKFSGKKKPFSTGKNKAARRRANNRG